MWHAMNGKRCTEKDGEESAKKERKKNMKCDFEPGGAHVKNGQDLKFLYRIMNKALLSSWL